VLSDDVAELLQGGVVNEHVRGQDYSRAILFISALDLWSMGSKKGGPALWRTLNAYADRGWDIFFITGNHHRNRSDDSYPNIHVIRFDLPWLKSLLRIKKLGFFAKVCWWSCFQVVAFVKAVRLHAKHPFDVIYGYEIWGVPVAKVLSKLWHVPIVSRFQGTSLGVFWMKKRLWRIRAWDHVWALTLPTDLLIMTNDGTQGDRVLQSLAVNMKRVKFWMNGVEWSLFESMPDIQRARHLLSITATNVLLTISRLASWKRVDRSIHALTEVVQSFPNTLLIIVGSGPERERLERLVCELGLVQHVRFEGSVPHEGIPNYLAAADVFLSFYDWSNVGNPLLEAMMAGKCLVTLNNGDTGQFVRDGDNGVLLEDEDLPHLPQVIGELLVDEERRRRLGNNARKFAEEHFWTWEERMEHEIAAVESLVTRDRRNG
jgi:glycosyltransferase involved in cell wall biosynthesis